MVVSDGERWVAAENITRWEQQLKDEWDEQRRRVLRDLIDLERDKLHTRNSQKVR